MYRFSICKKPIDANYSTLTEKIESSLKAPKFKMDDKIMITKYKNNFSKYYTNIWSIETPMINFVLKANS